MRTTLALDDELLQKAEAYTGLREKSALVREALRALIERERRDGWRALVAPSPRWHRRRGAGRTPNDPAGWSGQMVLVDTSVWVDHLRTGSPVLSGLLDGGRVLGHPFVTGELSLGKCDSVASYWTLCESCLKQPSPRKTRCST